MPDQDLAPGLVMRRPPGRAWLLAVAWCLLIFATSSTVITPRRFFAWIAAHVLTDAEAFRKFTVFWGLSWFVVVKGWHAAEYALLYLTIRAALARIAPDRPRRNLGGALAACLLFAASDEYHQTFVPGRNGTPLDVAIDGLGAGLAALIASLHRGDPARGTRGRTTDHPPSSTGPGAEC